MPAVRPRPCESVVGAAGAGHDLTAGSCDPQRRRETELPRSALLHSACNVILLGQVACVLCIVLLAAGCVNLSFAYVEGESLLMAMKDVALSSGRSAITLHPSLTPHSSLLTHPSLTPHSSHLTHTVRVRQPPWSRPTCCGPLGQTRTSPTPPSGLASGGSPQRRRWTSLWPSVWLASASSGR